VLGDRHPGRGVIAELDEVCDAPVDTLQLGLAIARLARRGDQLVGDPEPLLRMGRPPECDVAGAEGL